MQEFQNRILMKEGSAKVGHTVHKMCNIVDMNGASMRLASRKAMDVFKGIAAVDQDNYPETSACPTAVPLQHVNNRLTPPRCTRSGSHIRGQRAMGVHCRVEGAQR